MSDLKGYFKRRNRNKKFRKIGYHFLEALSIILLMLVVISLWVISKI